MKKMMLSIVSVTTLFATSCKKDVNTTSVSQATPVKAVKMDGGSEIEPWQMHNPIVLQYDQTEAFKDNAPIDVRIDRSYALAHQLFGTTIDAEVLNSFKSLAMSRMTYLNMLTSSNRLRSVAAILPIMANAETDAILRKAESDFYGSAINNHGFNATANTAFLNVSLNGDAAIKRDAISGIYVHGNNMYHDPNNNSTFGHFDDDYLSALELADAAGYGFGGALCDIAGITGDLKKSICVLFSCACSEEVDW